MQLKCQKCSNLFDWKPKLGETKRPKSCNDCRKRKLWVPTDKELGMIEALAAKMMSLSEISVSLGYGSGHIARYKEIHEEVATALENGQAKGLAKVTNKLYDAGMNGNITALIFILKSKAGWIDRPTNVQIQQNNDQRPPAKVAIPDQVSEDGFMQAVQTWQDSQLKVVNGGKDG